ncbi:hypothetical protein FQR65_LT05864 [Abscondita terminalis]|nr:hypothetical protein FQR65_LT05864 [Abscondita terminalis]
MLQEDSNGETTFEIIDKKSEEIPNSIDKTESFSSMSSTASLLPSPSVSLISVPASTGNLLSNIAPPSALPNFVSPMLPSKSISAPTQLPPHLLQPSPIPSSQLPPQHTIGYQPQVAVDVQPVAEPYYPTQFKSSTWDHTEKINVANENSGGILSWMKGAVSTGGILSRVAEKAKNSVDSMITTLDPQMREYIYSGGDMDILVASGQEVKISPIREAFQGIFGKATVEGVHVETTNIAAQPVGFAAGIKSAEERIEIVFQNTNAQAVPVVSIENFLLEVGEDTWYDLGVLILKDPVRQITLQTFTQMTPVPTAVVTLAQEDTPSDYPFKWSGYSVTIGGLMAKNLGVAIAYGMKL